jgi:N-methylhydantoinase A
VFCALGVLSSDFVLRTDQGVGWDLGSPAEVGRVNEIADRMAEDARREMAAEGFSDEDMTIVRTGDFRFQGQEHELEMPVPDRTLTEGDAQPLADEFLKLYERTYGEGTAWKGVPTTLVNYSVTVIGRQPRPALEAASKNGSAPDDIVRETREVYLPSEGRRAEVPVYDGARFTPGTRVEGPAIVDETDTTIYVPPGTVAERDEYMNYVLHR